MLSKVKIVSTFFILMMICCYISCKERHRDKKIEIVKTLGEMDDEVADNLKNLLLPGDDSDSKINDFIRLAHFPVVNSFYRQNDYKSLWSSKESWVPLADSMFYFIKNCRYYGLYPDDYYYPQLDSLRKRVESDSLTRMDAFVWTKADLMLTDAFMKVLKDLKEGRLIADSVSIISKQKYIDSFFITALNDIKKTNTVFALFNSIEPVNADYHSLRRLLTNFVDSMDTKKYLYISYPYKDSLGFIKDLHKRLIQSGPGDSLMLLPDSVMMVKEIKRYQKLHGLTVDGKAGKRVITTLNSNDNEKFKRIAVTLDRYKLLPPLPPVYVWVNLPGFYLKLLDNDSVILESKVIIGKPSTRTPLLTSAITNMITYPNWTIPESIIRKDILPALKTDPGYLARKGFSLVDARGETVNPYTVNWSKYTRGIPWKVVQGSGDDNALGIFKFNFNNPYSVYLHDTNQRYLFKNADRALSHGCVRVQNWQELAYYIARSDSIAMGESQSISYNTDSIKAWIANKSRKQIFIKKKLPLYIQYFTCEAKNNKIVVYDDIYNEDQLLVQKYFVGK